MPELEALIEGLSPQHRELLLRRVGEGEAEKAPSRISRRGASGPAPLSFSQERMWFLEQLDPGQSAFNLFNGLRIRGPLDVATLERCLSEVAARHEILRTVFRQEGGRLLQVAALEPTVRLPVLDLRALAPRDREREVRRLASAECQKPFDLARGPLLRTALLALEPQDHVLFVTMHHIISDGWSMAVLVREVAALYRAFFSGQASPLGALPLQYADFALWQREWLEGSAQADLSYWKGVLGGRLPRLLLPTDRSRSVAPGFRAAVQTTLLSPGLADGLRTLARGEGVTLFMTLLAAFNVLLQRYTRQDDLVLGCPIANRNRVEIEGLIGCFLNTLVLRTDLAGDPAFRELLGRVREATLGAYSHQDLPLEMLLKALPPEEDASRSPFQVMFLLQNFPAPDLSVAGLTLTPFEAEQSVDLGTAAFDLTLALTEREDGLEVSATYNEHLFEAGTLRRMLGHYRTLLEAVAADPERPLSAYALLKNDERRLLLSWTGQVTAPGDELAVHRAFEQQAARAPGAIAVVHEEREFSYAELNRRANQLARHLRSLGVGPEARVGIHLDRSPEMVVAVLGALKAGGAYVPLDPASPKERLRLVLEDVSPAVVLTSALKRDALPGCSARVVCVDGDAEFATTQSGENLEGGAGPEGLAYLIYTSGSTGRPRGVMVRHRSLARYTETARREYALGPPDRALQFASLSFDASAEEIYPTLTAGARLVLRTDSMLTSMAEFLARCRAWGVTVLNLPTAYWHEMVERMREQSLPLPPSVRVVIIGGEAAVAERLAAWQVLAPGAMLVNTYGPTETTIVAAMWRPPAVAWEAAREVPIGRAVGGARIYALDRRLEPSPIGVPGELYIGGAGLARGYLGSPELTAERFLPSSFDDEPGARLYRSGDLGRYRSDGTLEFLGRVDHQVKVRGFRIELGEIERTLAEHPDVEQVVATLREDVAGEKRIVAYVVCRRGEAREGIVTALRAFLAARLPDYMVPAHMFALDQLPLSPSGKVDRRALPVLERDRPEPGCAFAAPRSPIEEKLAAIWSSVLRLGRVGVHDNFFHLGGHSLLLTHVLYQVQKAFEVQVPLRTLIEEPTIAELALSIEELMLDQVESLADDDAADQHV